MSSTFDFEKEPIEESFSRLSALWPRNPFLTNAYARARARMNETPWLIHITSASGQTTDIPAFMRVGRVNRSLEIPSFPANIEWPAFSQAVLALCREARITSLTMNTFGADTDQELILPEQGTLHSRTEFSLNLLQEDLAARFSLAHRRNIRKAEREGLKLSMTTDADACLEHLQLFSSSVTRRVNRGEDISFDDSPSWLVPFVEEKAGTIFRVEHGGSVIASCLLLRSSKGAYYFSSGANEQGRRLGAAQYLVAEASRQLREQGVETFNLGGARAEETGLFNFKEGFSGNQIPLSSAQFRLGNAVYKFVDYLAAFTAKTIKRATQVPASIN